MINLRILKDKTAGGVMFFLTIATLLLVFVMGIGLFIKSPRSSKKHSLKELLVLKQLEAAQERVRLPAVPVGNAVGNGSGHTDSPPHIPADGSLLTEYARPSVHKYVFPALDILAGLPSVIYGVWGTLLIVPWISINWLPISSNFRRATRCWRGV